MKLLSPEVEAYVRDFPYQETYKYLMAYTQGDATRLNKMLLPPDPVLLKAGDDKVVRSNNDTFYNIAFYSLAQGPVVLRSDAPAEDRFVSFQLMDDHNVNFCNLIHPSGAYTLYRGSAPAVAEGELVESPSDIGVVVVRVEVRDKFDSVDVAAAEQVYRGISIDGPTIEEMPVVDRLSVYSDEVAAEANRLLDETFLENPFSEMVVGPGKELGVDATYLNHAAGTKAAWGGPAVEHSSYESLNDDADGAPLIGADGPYTLTTDAPPVDGFWSVTVYDSERGGFFHPNADDRYHINNTTAVPNPDGTYTFVFATRCAPEHVNCIEVPAGKFDLAARYYLPRREILSGDWTIARPVRVDTI